MRVLSFYKTKESIKKDRKMSNVHVKRIMNKRIKKCFVVFIIIVVGYILALIMVSTFNLPKSWAKLGAINVMHNYVLYPLRAK